jgi:hypothetical protein
MIWAPLAAVIAVVGLIALSKALPQTGSGPLTANVGEHEYRASIPYELQLTDEPQPYGTLVSNDPELNGRAAYRIGTIDPLALLIAGADGTTYRLLWGPRMEDAYPEICQYLPPEQQAVASQCVDSVQ